LFCLSCRALLSPALGLSSLALCLFSFLGRLGFGLYLFRRRFLCPDSGCARVCFPVLVRSLDLRLGVSFGLVGLCLGFPGIGQCLVRNSLGLLGDLGLCLGLKGGLLCVFLDLLGFGFGPPQLFFSLLGSLVRLSDVDLRLRFFNLGLESRLFGIIGTFLTLLLA